MPDLRHLINRTYNSAVAWSWVMNGLRLASGVLLLPLLLHYLNEADFGMYFVFLHLGALVPILDFGFFSEHRSRGELCHGRGHGPQARARPGSRQVLRPQHLRLAGGHPGRSGSTARRQPDRENYFAVNKASLLAGKYVHSEKPLSIAPDEAHELVDLIARQGLLLSSNSLQHVERNRADDVKSHPRWLARCGSSMPLDGHATMVLAADRLFYRLTCYHRHAD
jgi:hypothetical protein